MDHIKWSGASENKQTGQSDTDNVPYNCTLTYGTCASLGILYSFFVNLYNRSYFLVIQIKYLRNKDGEPMTPFKLATSTKTSILHLCILFFPYVVQRYNSHIGKKAFSMCHQAKKGFWGILAGIPQNQKEYYVYVPYKRKILSLEKKIGDTFSSALLYMSSPYA